MKQRLNYGKFAPDAMAAMGKLDEASGGLLEESLLDLIKLRASQINGCGYCIDMHTKDARDRGETEQRLYSISAWRESPFYTDRERAALAWTEALTFISDGQAPDSVYATALEAGATSVQEPRDEFYGDRTSGVRDPFGNLWWIATRQFDVSPDDLTMLAEARARKR